MVRSEALQNVTVPRPTLRGVVTVPLRLRTYGVLVYLALAFPLGIAYFVGVVVGLSVGLGLSILLVGVPILLATVGAVVVVATGERLLAQRLLGADIPAPDWQVLHASGLRDRTVALVTDLAVWGALLFVVSKLAVGIAGFTLLVVVFSFAGSLLATPWYYDSPGASVGLILPEPITRELSVVVPWEQFEVGLSFVVRVTSWEVTTLPEAVLASVVGLVVLLAGLNLTNALGWLCARWAELTLNPATATNRTVTAEGTE